jgi:hypothetical protein
MSPELWKTIRTVARTVGDAIRSWPATMRLCVLITVAGTDYAGLSWILHMR